MDKPKKDPILLNQNSDYKLCLNCGFPNRNTDASCIYCHSNLVEDTGLFSWFRQTYYILRWRWELRQRRENLKKSKKSSLFSHLGYFLLGIVLAGVGVYVFTMAVAESSFSNGLIAVLFFAYGFFTLKTLLAKK